MWNKTLASQLLRRFADERRRVVSDWRILIGCRRICEASNAPLPDEKKAISVRRELGNRGELVSPEGHGLSGIYLINSPYANLIDVSEEQMIQEANPWAVFSHLTAMAYHGLTDLISTQIFATQFSNGITPRIPLGTTPEDWVGLRYPHPRRPRRVRESEVTWSTMREGQHFGVEVGHNLGAPIYVTDVERTLIDALRAPEKSGGFAKVFRAWRRATSFDPERLVDYTDRFESQLLRQRVGFLLEALHRPNPLRERWRNHLLRGGSARLAPGEPYAGVFSAEWNLSLNVPGSVLAILEED